MKLSRYDRVLLWTGLVGIFFLAAFKVIDLLVPMLVRP